MSLSSRRAAAWAISLALYAASEPEPASAELPAPPPTATNRRIIEEGFARWTAGGSGFFDEVLADHVVWTIEGSGPSAGEYRGRAAFVERAVHPFAARLASPVRPTRVRIWADGDHVIAQWKGEGVARDGRPYRNSYAWIFRMQGGQAVEVSAFLDLAAYDDVLRRLPLPAPATPGPAPAPGDSPRKPEEQ
jgi:ketosteroid isomerase-like protein